MRSVSVRALRSLDFGTIDEYAAAQPATPAEFGQAILNAVGLRATMMTGPVLSATRSRWDCPVCTLTDTCLIATEGERNVSRRAPALTLSIANEPVRRSPCPTTSSRSTCTVPVEVLRKQHPAGNARGTIWRERPTQDHQWRARRSAESALAALGRDRHAQRDNLDGRGAVARDMTWITPFRCPSRISSHACAPGSTLAERITTESLVNSVCVTSESFPPGGRASSLQQHHFGRRGAAHSSRSTDRTTHDHAPRSCADAASHAGHFGDSRNGQSHAVVLSSRADAGDPSEVGAGTPSESSRACHTRTRTSPSSASESNANCPSAVGVRCATETFDGHHWRPTSGAPCVESKTVPRSRVAVDARCSEPFHAATTSPPTS